MAACGTCAGRGQVVQPVIIVDPDTGEITVEERAGMCPSCAGSGEE